MKINHTQQFCLICLIFRYQHKFPNFRLDTYESWFNENLIWKRSFKTKMDISLFLYLDGTKDDQSFYLSSFKYTVNSPMENLFIKTAKNVNIMNYIFFYNASSLSIKEKTPGFLRIILQKGQ